MSISPINAPNVAVAASEVSKLTSSVAPVPALAATLQQDTVSLSDAGRAAAAGGHDGDSDGH